MSKDDTLVLAHYYTTPDIQQQADFVGDSLDLALKAYNEKPKRIVFAGVRFMAETAKIINPETEVILPDVGSTCSLVEMTDIQKLRNWVAYHKAKDPSTVHVSYINSSAEHKVLSDFVVTSRIVDDVIEALYAEGKNVIFSPDRNMGLWLNSEFGYNMPVWTAVCEVHDKFKANELQDKIDAVKGPAYVLAHPESTLPVLEKADYIGSTKGMLNWIEQFDGDVNSTIFIATETGLLYNMAKLRPELNIKQAPTYTGCQCNDCPYMKLNTKNKIQAAIAGNSGLKINYLSSKIIEDAYIPIERMMYFNETGNVSL